MQPHLPSSGAKPPKEPLLEVPDNQLGLDQTPVRSTAPVPTPLRTDLSTIRGMPTPRKENNGLQPQRLDYADERNARPTPGSLTLNEEAIEQRLRRLMTPRSNGQHKISADVVRMYKEGGKGKQDVFRMFQAAGFDVDWFCQTSQCQLVGTCLIVGKSM